MNALEYIKENLTKEMVLDLLSRHGARQINVNGNEIRSTCCLHGGDNPTAFVWNLENKMWYCFTGDCGGGDVFQFIANLYDMDISNEFKDIIRKTAEELNIDISNLELTERMNRNKREVREWLRYCDSHHESTNQVYDIRRLGQRYVLNGYRGFDAELLSENGVTYNKDYNRIQFNIYDEDSNIIGAVLRRVDENEPKKWLNRPKYINTGEVLYNLNNIPSEELSIIITEGIIDVLRLKQLGVNNAVATFGAHLTDEQIELIEQRFIEVILMYDNDAAGIKATRKAIELLKNKVRLWVYDLSITGCKDPGELNEENHNNIKLIRWHDWLNKINGDDVNE